MVTISFSSGSVGCGGGEGVGKREEIHCHHTSGRKTVIFVNTSDDECNGPIA
jgi:hypothetical protein